MKPIIVSNSKILTVLSYISPVNNIWAITIWPFVFCKGEMDDKTINHESIHIEQYNDLFVIGFFIVYVLDWIHGRIKYRSNFSGYRSAGEKAYCRTRAEQESYYNEENVNYIIGRKRYRWLKEYKV